MCDGAGESGHQGKEEFITVTRVDTSHLYHVSLSLSLSHTHTHTHTQSDVLMEDSRDKGTDNHQLSAAFLMFFHTHTPHRFPAR